MIRSFGVVVLWSQDCIGCSKVPAGKLPGNIILLYINNCWIGQQTSLNLVTDDASYYYYVLEMKQLAGFFCLFSQIDMPSLVMWPIIQKFVIFFF